MNEDNHVSLTINADGAVTAIGGRPKNHEANFLGRGNKSAFIIAYGAVAISGGVTGLLIGFLIWGLG